MTQWEYRRKHGRARDAIDMAQNTFKIGELQAAEIKRITQTVKKGLGVPCRDATLLLVALADMAGRNTSAYSIIQETTRLLEALEAAGLTDQDTTYGRLYRNVYAALTAFAAAPHYTHPEKQEN